MSPAHWLSERGIDALPEAMADQPPFRQRQTVAGLLHDGRIDESTYHQFLYEFFDYPMLGPSDDVRIDVDFVRRFPISFCRNHSLMAIAQSHGHATIVTCDPHNDAVFDHLAVLLGFPVEVCLAPKERVTELINTAYTSVDSDFTDVLTGEHVDGTLDDLASLTDSDLLDTASRAPVIKLVSMVLFEAVKRRASDVHIQPFEDRVQVRYRVDGVLYDYVQAPRSLLDEIISRVKVIGKMDIAEKRLAQDGRTTVSIGDRSIDLRISVIPTNCGERAVLRLLDKSQGLFTLSQLGMSQAIERQFARLIGRPHGIVLVTGPTGSGKSTTLYAGLQHLDCNEKNILTLEDPIEYQLSGISQTQVSTKKGMTFANGLRAVLRQDPDVIMVGEIRDEETARMAVQSSLTGHLVFSTLHTNDAAGAITRLLDLGIEPYLAASSLLAVLAQRLVRILCPQCREPKPLSESMVQTLGLERATIGRPVATSSGCGACNDTGFVGRKGIFELLIVTEKIRSLIVARAKATAIKSAASANGMTTLRQSGIDKFLSAETTLEEVTRVAMEDEGDLDGLADSPAPASDSQSSTSGNGGV